MRYFSLAMGLALASMFAIVPAKAEFGGPNLNSQGQCRQYGPNNQNLTYYYWGSCPSTQVGTHGHVHVNTVSGGAVRHRHQ
jgi:hypothetical protein